MAVGMGGYASSQYRRRPSGRGPRAGARVGRRPGQGQPRRCGCRQVALTSPPEAMRAPEGIETAGGGAAPSAPTCSASTATGSGRRRGPRWACADGTKLVLVNGAARARRR